MYVCISWSFLSWSDGTDHTLAQPLPPPKPTAATTTTINTMLQKVLRNSRMAHRCDCARRHVAGLNHHNARSTVHHANEQRSCRHNKKLHTTTPQTTDHRHHKPDHYAPQSTVHPREIPRDSNQYRLCPIEKLARLPRDRRNTLVDGADTLHDTLHGACRADCRKPALAHGRNSARCAVRGCRCATKKATSFTGKEFHVGRSSTTKWCAQGAVESCGRVDCAGGGAMTRCLDCD